MLCEDNNMLSSVLYPIAKRFLYSLHMFIGIAIGVFLCFIA